MTWDQSGVVPRFENEYHFLSNFHINPFTWRNVVFPTGEHAFQAAKGFHIKDSYINDITDHIDLVLKQPTPGKAKYVGKSAKIERAEWDLRRISYMREIVHARFSTSEREMVGQLIDTGAMMLVEGNDWDDEYWGRCLKNGKWVGLNTLGVILMEERGFWLRGNND